MYEALYYRNAATTAMYNESFALKGNAEIVKSGAAINVPMLLFVSNTVMSNKYSWQGVQQDFLDANTNANGEIIFLDVPHFVHDYAYEEISIKIENYIEQHLE